MTLGDRIKKVRKEEDLTQQRFAEKIGTTANVLTNYETGRRNPSSSVINNICKTFYISEEWLRTGKGERHVPKEADPLEELVKQRDLSDGDRLLIEKFLRLEKEERQAVIKFLSSFAGEFASLEPLAPVSELSASDDDADAYGEKAKKLTTEARLSEKKPDAPASSVSGSAGA